MGINLPTDPVAEEAGAFIRDMLAKPIGLAEVPAIVEDVSTFLLQRAAVAAVAGGGTAAVADASVVAGAIAAILDLPWIVLAIIVIILILVIERALAGLLSWLPMDWGKRWAQGIHRVFSPVEHLENIVASSATNAIAGVFHGIAVVVGWGMDQNQPHTATIAKGSTAQSWDYLNKRTMALWAWDSRLQADVTALQRALQNPVTHVSPVTAPPTPEPPTVIQNTTVTTPVPQNVWDQLSHLESQNQARINEIHTLQSTVNAVSHTQATLQQEFATLSRNVHSIRAISVGLQDMQNDLDVINHLFLDFSDYTLTQLEQQTHELTQLAPLHLLLQTGAPGMQTLRQLQDTPCMCPKLPRIPRLHPELLAMYEFMTNG